MEIIYRTNDEMSNFSYCSKIFKNKKPLNGFNKMLEQVKIESVDDENFNVQNVFFKELIEGYLYLCYPFSVVIKEKIKFDSLHSLISEIRRVYKEAYNSDKEIGIWGHDIGDLCIEAIKIYEGNLVDVSIGS